MAAVSVLTLFFLVQSTLSLNAFNFIEKHKTIINLTFTVLKSSKSTLLQYEYVLANKRKNGIADLKGTSLVAGFPDNSDLSFDCDYKNGLFQGYSLDILQNLQEQLEFHVQIKKLNKSVAEEIDLILCHKNPDKLRVFALHSTLNSKYVLINKYNNVGDTKDIFKLTFVGTLWLCFLIILILLALCLKVSTKQYAIIWKKDHPWNWVEITLWAIATICQQGLSYTPRGFCSHTIFLMGYLTAYLLYTGFAAGITSILVGKDIQQQLSLQQIKNRKAPLVSIDYLKKDLPHDLHNYEGAVYVRSVPELFAALDNKNVIGIAPRIFLDDYMAKNFNYELVSLYHLTEIEIFYRRNLWVLHKDIADIFNEKLILMQQTGVLERLLQNHQPNVPIAGYQSDYSSVGREHVGSAILLFIGGAVGSVVFLLAEFAYAFYGKCRGKRRK